MEQNDVTIKNSLKALQELEDLFKMEDLVKDNKIEFNVDTQVYRLRLPNQSEKRELEQARRKKYIELTDSKSPYLFRAQWIERYKSKGIDINELEKSIQTDKEKVKQLMLKLATTGDIPSVETLKKEIIALKDKMADTSIKITSYLTDSIEDTMMIFINSYTAYMVLEKQNKSEWNRAFSSFEEFEKCEDSNLLIPVFRYLNYLLYPIQNEN